MKSRIEGARKKKKLPLKWSVSFRPKFCFDVLKAQIDCTKQYQENVSEELVLIKEFLNEYPE